jgi:hypothetical protein
MSTDDTTAQKSAVTTAEPYTHHVEPPAQGGEAYIRCEACSREVIGRDPSRIPHAAGCANR